MKKVRYAELSVGREFTYCGFELVKKDSHSATGGGKRWFMSPGDLVIPKPVADDEDEDDFRYPPFPWMLP